MRQYLAELGLDLLGGGEFMASFQQAAVGARLKMTICAR
jgi:hypothetical protein